MTAFLLRRLGQGLVVVFGVVTFTFVLIHAAPGEPFADVLEDARLSPDALAALRARYGLDQPLPTQYGRFLWGVARGDLGLSLSQQRPVAAVLADALPNTLLLMSVALVLGFAGGIALGAAQGARPGSRFDRLTGSLGLAVAALPEFWLALMAMLLLAGTWRLLPVSGMIDPVLHPYLSPAGRVLDVARHLVLPAGTLALIIGAAVSRYQRAALLEVLPDPFVRTARAKGAPRRAVIFRHALRNALLPIITLGGLAVPALLGGAVFVEGIFAWPGMGRLVVEAVETRDYPVVLASVMLGSVLVVLGGLIADLLYAAADPRLRRA
ncbi:MAG TPA: ABC transporter permease [Gemmatimonadaceae bacterium]|nr:ABC transporter permease [Gemmatimonadaceae bacterium]